MTEFMKLIEAAFSLLIANSTLMYVTAPNLIWCGCMVIVGIFTWSALQLWRKSSQLIRDLREQSSAVQKSIRESGELTGKELESLSKSIASSSYFKHIWSEFRETLLSEDLDGRKLIFNTRAASEFFSKEQVIEANMKVAWYQAVPGVLTSIGLLCTFAAILLGLHGLVDPASSEISQAGMVKLVESLSGKFLSSVCALLLATVFTGFEKRRTNQVERAHKALVRAIDERFPRRSSEYLLEKIVVASNEQANQLRHFGADLSGRLKEGMTESFQPILERLTDAINKLEKEKSDSLQGSMTGILEEFRTLISKSAEGEITKLSTVLSDTSSLLKASNDQTMAAGQRMQEVLGGLGDSMRTQSEANTQLLAKLSESVEGMSLRLQQASEDSSSKVAQKVQDILSNLESSAFRTLEESKKQTSALSQIVESMTTRVEGALNGVSGVMTEKITTVLANLEASSQAAAQESKQQAQALSLLAQSISDKFEAVLQTASGSMSQTVSGLVSQTSQLSEATTSKLALMLDRQSEGATLLQQAGETVDRSLTRFQELLSASNETQRLYGENVRNLGEVSRTILDDLNLTRSVQSDFGTVSRTLKEAGEGLSTIQEQHRSMLQEYDRVFKTLDTQLGSLIERMHSNTQTYNSRIKEALVDKLSAFDNHLSSATSILGETVAELNDAMIQLSEIIRNPDQDRK